MTRSRSILTSSEAPPAPARYRLKFVPAALEEWNALDGSIKTVFKKLLRKRLEQPRLPGAELHHELRDCYKIKWLKQGYRLVYQVEDDVLGVLVLAVAKREGLAVYRAAIERLVSDASDAARRLAQAMGVRSRFRAAKLVL